MVCVGGARQFGDAVDDRVCCGEFGGVGGVDDVEYDVCR